MEQVAKGIYKIHIGEPEAFTPMSFKDTEVKIESIGQVPISNSMKLVCDDIKWKRTIQGLHFTLPIHGSEDIYGFGLQLFSVNQAGMRRVIKVNSDPPADTGESHAPVPFYISTAGYGLFVDTYRNAVFHMGTAGLKGDSSHMSAENEVHKEFSEETLYSLKKFDGERQIIIDIPSAGGITLYLFEGSVKEIVQRYNLFSGGGCVPPMWGLGVWYRTYGGSRQEDVIAAAEKFVADQMPVQVLGLEPGWQSHTYACSFKWSELYPNPKSMISTLGKKGIKVNLWEHAFVYPTAKFYEEIMPFSGDYEVWNGLVPDFASKEARELFMEYHCQEFTQKGVSGFKLDECDNSDYNLSNWSYPDSAVFPSGMDGEQMHSAIGVLYQSVIHESFKCVGQSTYSQVRSSGALASYLPFVLYSDLYDHRQFIKGLLTAGFSGLLWCPEIRDCEDGADLLRRMETVMFSSQALINGWRIPSPPWKQVDIEKNLQGQEMEDAAYYTEKCRMLMNLRMGLIPYLYSAFIKYHLYGVPPIRSMVMEYPEDLNVRNIEDQYFFGDSMLVCPLTGKDGVSRSVYLPNGNWYHFFTKKRYEGGRVYQIHADYDEVPIFVKDGTIVPMAKPLPNVTEDTVFEMSVHVFGKEEGTFTLYQDAGLQDEETDEYFKIELVREKEKALDVIECQKCSRYKISEVVCW